MKLSLAMITKNALEDLQRLKPLVKPYVDEWVVVFPPEDPGIKWAKQNGIKAIVKDFTQPIEPKYHKKMLNYGLEVDKNYRLFNFANARNESFKHCTGDYILWLDADDEPVGLDKLKEFVEIRGQIDIFDALYDYGRDAEGNPISDHVRERVIKNNDRFEWRGAALGLIHETIVPKNFHFPSRLEVPTDVFRVLHVPYAGHSDESSMRNHLALLYEYLKTDGADARTTYYLGTEYFNRKMYEYAIKIMLEYIRVGGWDEERYRAWLRIAEAYHQLEDKESSRNAYLNGTKELPSYPDAWLGLGESYYSDEQWHRAIEFLMIGLQKPVPQTKSAIDMTKYAFRPLIFLANSYVKIGKSQEGYNWFLKAKKVNPKHPWVHKYEKLFLEMKEMDEYVRSFVRVGQLAKKYYPEVLPKLAETIPEQIKDQEVLLDFRRRFAKTKTWPFNSVVVFGSMAFEDWGPDSLEKGCGGSEEAVINLTKRWAQMGWEVTVFNNCPEEKTVDGVSWVRYEKFNPRDDFNILISWRNNPYLQPKKARKRFVDVHDVPNNLYYTPDSVKEVTMMVKSNYHRSLFPQLPDDNFAIVNNGIDLRQFDEIPKKNKNNFVWTSSYNRGLEYLLEMWPDVLKADPKATLDIAYGWMLWDKSPDAQSKKGQQWKTKIQKLMEQPGITHHGRVSNEEVARLYLRADIWAYPTDFPEIDCMTATKAMAAGCVPITTSYAAMAERNQGIMIEGSADNPQVRQKFKKELINLIRNENLKQETRKRIDVSKYDWDTVARKWDGLFRKELDSYPLVSVIVPHLPERKEMLEECLASIKAQTYPHIEIIVEEDNGDGKPSVVKNRAIKKAKGEWHYFLDDDDKFWSQHSLLNLMEHQNDGDLIFSDTLLAFPDKEVLMEHRFGGLDNLKKHNELPGVYLLKAEYSQKILFNENMATAEDYERSIRLVEAGAKPYHVNLPHYWYRQHGSQIQYLKQKEQDRAVEELHEDFR